MVRISNSILVLILALITATSALGQTAGEILKQSKCTGGLIVVIGDGSATFVQQLIALGGKGPYVVYGLTKDATKIAAARKSLKGIDITGRVTIDHWHGGVLPLIPNTVNVLVHSGEIPAAEVQRVLVPNGVALASGVQTMKPRPKNIDEWTHFLRDADNNAVAEDDVIGIPYHFQWVGDPKWARHHNFISSTSGAVSAQGRLFTIIDEGQVVSLERVPQWFLVARDAFNGVVLWRRKIGPWEGHMRPFRSGPAEISRRLVAVGDRVYVTLGYGKPVTALDAATGKTVMTYAKTAGASEISCVNGRLHLVIGKGGEPTKGKYGALGPRTPIEDKRLRVVDAATGKLLWEKYDAETKNILPTAVSVSGDNLYFKNLKGITCLNARTGEKRWFTPSPSLVKRVAWGAPTLVVKDGVVLCADRTVKSAENADRVTWKVTAQPRGNEGSELLALDATTGRKLWSSPCEFGYCSPTDIFVVNDVVWFSTAYGNNDESFSQGRDLRTGKVKVKLNTAPAFEAAHHHRCYRDKATSRYILLGRTGVEFIGFDKKEPQRHCWFRGVCQYGLLPCNGLIYIPPHACACYVQSKLTGFNALAPKRETIPDNTPRLEKGPAYQDASPASAMPSGAWPTFRNNPARTGRTTVKIGGKLEQLWSVALHGKLTPPVAARGVVCVAEIDAHTVHGISASTGQLKWSFAAGARVDSPPTIHGNRAYFGCADGYVYALRLQDGTLAWRFRAAPADRRLIARGQLESVWPVTGSVLIDKGKLFCTAGRSSFLDGGMVLVRLDPQTGKLLGETKLYSRDPVTGKEPEEIINDVELPGANPDVLVSTGNELFLRDRRMDYTGKELKPTVPHIYSPIGFLDDHWWHRTYWIYGTQVFGRASGWAVVASNVPSGRLLVEDENTIFGFGRSKVNGHNRRLFRSKKELKPAKPPKKKNNNHALRERLKPTKAQFLWTQEIPIVARGLVLTADALVLAGPDTTKTPDPIFQPEEPSKLITVDPKTGKTTGSYPIKAQPVQDGLIVAAGRVYMTTNAGTIECFSGKGKQAAH